MIEYETAVASTHSLVNGFVLDPNGRGTLGILFSCLSVLLLNTWTVLHLNIPPHKSPWRNYLHKTKWWIVAMICPDGLAVSSCEQWRNARRSVKELKAKYPWWTVTHGFYAEMGGYRVVAEDQVYIFRTKELIWLSSEKVITIPEVTIDDLRDRSNADWLVKGIAISQSAWFMLQVCARVNQKLPLTTLELVVVAFIFCTGLMYFFWWDKPMDLEQHTIIPDAQLTPSHLCRLAQAICVRHKVSEWYRPPPREAHHRGWDWFWFEKPMVLLKLSVISRGDRLPEELRVILKDNFTAHARVTSWYMPAVNESNSAEWGPWDHICVFTIGTVFNGLHCAAWNFHFPTPVESILWKVSVCVMLGVIYLWVPIAGATWWLPNRGRLKSIPYWFGTLCYFLARMYLLVEVFFGLRALEPKAFLTVEWTEYLPHYG